MKEKSDLLSAGHRARLKGRFLKFGIDSLADYEVIELLLFFSIPRKDTKSIAKLLLKKFGSISGILDAAVHELKQIPGIGRHTSAFLSCIKHVTQRYIKSKTMYGKRICSSDAALEYLTVLLRPYDKEVFHALFLSAQNEVIGEKTLFQGTVDQSAVYPREIIKEAIFYASNRIIVAHNHLAGGALPSASDKELTKQLIFSFGLMSMSVLDHVIISKHETYSFADHGIIRGFEDEYLNFSDRVLS